MILFENPTNLHHRLRGKFGIYWVISSAYNKERGFNLHKRREITDSGRADSDITDSDNLVSGFPLCRYGHLVVEIHERECQQTQTRVVEGWVRSGSRSSVRVRVDVSVGGVGGGRGGGGGAGVKVLSVKW
jgi:hypothetical protein